jgi:hypothetical protein
VKGFGRIDVEVTAGPIADAVIRRVVAASAAQSRLPIDRINDAVLAADALLGALATSFVSVTLVPLDEGIEVSIGPTSDREAQQILDEMHPGGPGAVVRGLSERVWLGGDPDGRHCITFRVGRDDTN